MREDILEEPAGAPPFPTADFQKIDAGSTFPVAEMAFPDRNIRGKPVNGELRFHTDEDDEWGGNGSIECLSWVLHVGIADILPHV